MQFLKPVQVAVLRTAIGVFKTSPYLSLCVEVAEIPLTYRRLYVMSDFLITSSVSTPPIYSNLFDNVPHSTHYPFPSTKYTFQT